MAAAQVDVPRLAAYVSLPEEQLQTLSSAPTADLVQAFFVQLTQKAAQHEQLIAEKLRVEVELENIVRSNEQKARLMRTNIEKAQNQITELTQQLQTEQAARQSLATELDTVKSSTSTSGAELSTLQHRISSLESSNRDTLALLESKSRAHDGLAQDLAAKHQKTVELRKEASDLEDKIRAASTAATSAKFREQALVQEVESLKRSNDYLDTELKTKTAEFTKFRKDKNARIAELQRQHEDDATTIESLQRAEKALRSRTAELEQKAEDYLTQIGQVKEELTRQEENFRSELDTANRLQELMKAQAETEKNRRAELQEQFESVQDEAREEFARIEEEMRTIQQDKDTAEQRIVELEAQTEQLQAEIATMSSMATPRFNGSVRQPGSAPRTPVRGMSPTAPGSAMKGNMNYTQLVTQNSEMRKERDSLKRHNQELTEQLDSMMQEFEQRRPALDQMQHEHERLQADVGEMSTLVESISNDREAAKKEARTYQGQVKGLTREGEFLRQQLRDLSSQIKILLLEVNARDQGQDSFSPDERIRLEQLARSEDDRQYNNDTDQFISQNLVAFNNIAELQAQNERLLRVARELGDRMEGEEARARETQAAQDHEEVQDLRQKYERLREEMKTIVTQSKAFIRERDIFRRMLSHRGQLPPQSDLESAFGQSVNGEVPSTPARNGLHASVEMSPNSKDIAGYAQLIKDLQTQHDGYKQEAASERIQLKDQVTSLTTKNGELRNELARKNGEVLLATERYEMLQGNYSMLKNENGELQKRSQANSDRATQQDLRVQAVAEELVETKASVESLRNESANLKAEKEFWKTIEKRLTDDNQSLIAERDRLNTLNANLQNLLNEREHSDAESRRRLQAQVEALENEIQTTKRKLSESEEEAKRQTLRREFDTQQSQTRIDDLVKSISTTREELSGTKATRDQLQLRVDELTIELRSAEERLQLLSLRPAGDNTTSLDDTMTIGQDQELALQVSELKRDLELAKKELSNTQEQVEQYKQISQSSEEELASLNGSHDQYREEMDRIIEEKESKITELEQTIDTMRRETDESTTELETLRTEKAEHDRVLREQRAQMETELNRFKDAAERAETAAQFHQEDLKAQAEIARQAQENYDTELQRHAEASKALQTVRTELNEAKLELVELRSARDAARNDLSLAEDNSSDAKSRYESEIAEIRSRRDDVGRQNKLLHEQLEKVNTQIAELQRARSAAAMPSESNTTRSDDSNLQELIKYLRREKEIVDVQYEMANQEAKRFRQQLEHTQSQLEDARLKLSQQLRSEEDRERSSLNHNKLIETINELNLIRESNATLRLERTQAQNAYTERAKEIEDLHNQLQPLHAKVQELEEISESQEQELRMTREARERFEQRYHDLLNKTDSVDPAELEALKEKTTTLETERDELKELSATLQSQVETIPAQIEEAKQELRDQNQASRAKLVEQAKNKNSQQVAKIRDLEASLQEKDRLQAQLTNVQAELETANREKSDLSTQLAQAQAQSDAAPDPVDVATSTSADAEQVTALQEQLSQANARAQSGESEMAELREQLSVAQGRISELEQELAGAQDALGLAQTQIQEHVASAATSTAGAQGTLDTAQIDKLREELAAAQKDAEALRTAATVNERSVSINEGAGQPSIADQITQNVEAIRAELEARHEERCAAAETRANDRVKQMKDLLNTRMREYRTTESDRLKKEYDQEMTKIREDHRTEIESLQKRHQSEVEELKIQLNAAAAKKEVNGSAGSEQPTTPTLASLPDDADAVRKLLQTSEIAKRILAGNIQKKVAEAQKELTDKLVKQEADALAAQEVAVKQARESAAEMESKRQQVKLNMAQNQLKIAKVKVDYVQSAATDTPDKAVKEVWAAAKDLKPAPTTAAGLGNSTFAPSTNSSPAPKPGPAGTQTPQQIAPTTNPFAQSAGSAATNPFTQTTNAPATSQAPAASAAPAATSLTQPASAASTKEPEASTQPQEAKVAKVEEPKALAGPQENKAPFQRPPSSMGRLPDAALGSGIGRGSHARGGAQSALPVPGGRGQQQQRGGIPRGNHGQRGGRGRGAGTGIPQPGAQGAGGLNPNAGQFVPKKRGLDASEHAGPNKRSDRGGKQ